MKLNQTKLNCQLPALESIQEGRASMPSRTQVKHLKFFIRRRFTPEKERTFKNKSNCFVNAVLSFFGAETRPVRPEQSSNPIHLKAGDNVRVKSQIEIDATLNFWRQLKGCTFMPEMQQFCNTRQQVHKRMERFVDERDLRVKKSSGIILLKNLFCEGTADFGSCDRSCYYFWREEWMEKIEDP